MSEVRLVVRELGRDWSGTVHGSAADRVIAALGADPITLTELETACGRYQRPDPNRRFFANLTPGLCDEPYDAGLIVIDLVARLVAVDSTYSSPGLSGDVKYHDGERATDHCLRYHLADDWLFTSYQYLWPGLAESRRRERAELPPLDSRAVLYGRPLIEFLARETFAAHARREKASTAVHDSIKEIHAAWLLTPRDDLRGVCPREVALERRDQITWDLQHQAERWSRLHECPPGLDESSFAYRYGGFGIHELVEYYEMVRELLWSCWNRLDELTKTSPAATGPELLTAGDFLTSEVPRLEQIRDEWLDTPNRECHGRTPRSIIHRERTRLPEGISGREAIIDPDCPCCQMAADMPGPMFWHLDGCEMDDDFAFDMYHRTREEWEAEQRKWEEHRQQFDADRERREAAESLVGEAEHAIWSSSFTAEDADNLPLEIRLFGLGGHLAELIIDLRNEAGGSSVLADVQQFIDQLNRDFGNLRELLQTTEPSLAASLLNPVMERFAETLSDAASARPDLSKKCESLTNELRRLFDATLPESMDGADDSDQPF